MFLTAVLSTLMMAALAAAVLYSAVMIGGIYKNSRRQADALERIVQLLKDRKGQP